MNDGVEQKIDEQLTFGKSVIFLGIRVKELNDLTKKQTEALLALDNRVQQVEEYLKNKIEMEILEEGGGDKYVN